MELIPSQSESKIVNFPGADVSQNTENIPTPKFDSIKEKAEKLSRSSSYQTNFDFNVYRDLETRFHGQDLRGGIVFNTPFKLVNSHTTCQQCLYSFEIDTYGRGCVHDCAYCYAKAELTVHGYWNKPFPMPIDITEIWKTFYTVFETDKNSKWRDVLEQRIPLRIGSMSDSFMHMDKKYKVTQELLRILDFYKYPYVIFTRSDLIAHDEYLALMNPDLCSVQISLSSTDDTLNKMIEPGTPSAKRRLKAMNTLVRNGFWTTARVNPFFPIYADGYFTDPDFNRSTMPEPFHFSSFEMIEEIAAQGVPSILAGMVRLSHISISAMERAIGRDLKVFFKDKRESSTLATRKTSRDYHLSDIESRAYYERIHAKCIQQGIQFSTCYIGNGEKQFWRDQDLWSNKKDCCNVVGRVSAFDNTKTSRDIPWNIRLKHTNHKSLMPNQEEMLHTPLGDAQPLIISSHGISLNRDYIQ